MFTVVIRVRVFIEGRPSYNQTVTLLILAPWRSGYAAVCKTVYMGSNPVGASSFNLGGWWNGIHGGLKIP